MHRYTMRWTWRVPVHYVVNDVAITDRQRVDNVASTGSPVHYVVVECGRTDGDVAAAEELAADIDLRERGPARRA